MTKWLIIQNDRDVSYHKTKKAAKSEAVRLPEQDNIIIRETWRGPTLYRDLVNVGGVDVKPQPYLPL